MPCNDESQDWGDISTSKGVPKIATKLQETLGESWNGTDSPSQLSEGNKSADTLISDFYSPEL